MRYRSDAAGESRLGRARGLDYGARDAIEADEIGGRRAEDGADNIAVRQLSRG